LAAVDEAPIVRQYRDGDREQLFQFIREVFSPDDGPCFSGSSWYLTMGDATRAVVTNVGKSAR
jgi:hypothetical protein